VAGAGVDNTAAALPARLPLRRGGRVLVFGAGLASSGITPDWAAGATVAGVNFLTDLSDAASLELTVAQIAAQIAAVRAPGDIVVFSIHWGGNWGYAIPAQHQRFARALIDTAGVDVVHGHSAHHCQGIEVYRDRLILYGCGDFINDYEGIGGHENYRGDLSLMYFPTLAADGRLLRCALVPLQIRRLRLHAAVAADVEWLCARLGHESARFGTALRCVASHHLQLLW
jgi:poly-gamma-glutamate capsule biosynthesis protein CapA/YwtB (metallophosphatase superfamily)